MKRKINQDFFEYQEVVRGRIVAKVQHQVILAVHIPVKGNVDFRIPNHWSYE